MALFEAGELRQAVLAFEAEVQRAPHNAEAWRMLGTSHVINTLRGHQLLTFVFTTFLSSLSFLSPFSPI